MTSWRGYRGTSGFPTQEALHLRSQQITGGKRTCQCTLRRLRIVRYEFGPSSWRCLVQCLRGMLARDDETIASGCTDKSGRVVDRGIGCGFQLPPASTRKPRARQASCRRGRLRTGVVTSAPNGASWRAACLVTLCFRLAMSRWRNYSAAIGTGAVRKFCPDAMSFEQFAPALLPFPFLCFSISSIDAPRGAVGWRRCRWPCTFARGERVYHGKQNDHRRFPPGGNQGGGPTRKSRRGV